MDNVEVTLVLAYKFYQKYKNPKTQEDWDAISLGIAAWSKKYPDEFTVAVSCALLEALASNGGGDAT